MATPPTVITVVNFGSDWPPIPLFRHYNRRLHGVRGGRNVAESGSLGSHGRNLGRHWWLVENGKGGAKPQHHSTPYPRDPLLLDSRFVLRYWFRLMRIL